jgi:cytochrome c556
MRKTLAVSLATLAVAALAAAQEPAANPDAQARHEAMEQVGDAMKVLGGMARGQAPFDAAAVKKSATTIAEQLAAAEKHFPPGSGTGKTRAKAEIWTSREDFDRLMKEAQTAAAALSGVTEEASYRPALGTLGTSCKSCHDMYRAPEH